MFGRIIIKFYHFSNRSITSNIRYRLTTSEQKGKAR